MESGTPTLTRRDRNKLRNRREIIAAALDVFAEKGYHKASIQEIADRADFAVSTIYGLFEDKKDLYHRVSVYVGRRTGEIFDEAIESGANEYEKLVNFARAMGRAYREIPNGSRMLENERYEQRLHAPPLPVDGILRIYERLMVRIQDLFRAGIAQGMIVDRDPVMLATMLESMMTGLIAHLEAEEESTTYEEHVEEAIEIFFGRVRLRKTPGKG